MFERAAGDLGDRGTGIGTREELFAVMRRIGLAADASIGIGVDGRVGLDRDGHVIHELPVRAVTSAWSRIWRPLRQALAGRLLRRRQGARAASSRRPTVSRRVFDDGSRAEGDLLVAADGLHSTVRAQFLPELAPRYAGYVAWRGVVEAGALSSDLHDVLFHRMVFGFPDGELMLSIPMPAPRGEGKRACHFVWFRPVTESALAGLCTDAERPPPWRLDPAAADPVRTDRSAQARRRRTARRRSLPRW